MNPRNLFRYMLYALAALTFSGCLTISRAGSDQAGQIPPFRPPTPAASPTVLVLRTAVVPTQLAGAEGSSEDCVNVLSFLADQTIPDGTVVGPESTLDKRWEVENSGGCNWDENYRVRLIAGPEMGAQPEQALHPARSGSRVVIRMLFKAPAEPGSYRSAWQAFDPAGEPFGDPFFIDIVVSDTP